MTENDTKTKDITKNDKASPTSEERLEGAVKPAAPVEAPTSTTIPQDAADRSTDAKIPTPPDAPCQPCFPEATSEENIASPTNNLGHDVEPERPRVELPAKDTSPPPSRIELPTIICTRDRSPLESESDSLADPATSNSNTLTTPNQQERLNTSDEEEPLDSLPPSPTLSPASSRLPSPTHSDRYLSPDFVTPVGSPKASDRDQDDDTASIATQDEEMQDPVREKRCTAIKILREIELDFAKLRQRLYREKVAELNKEIAYIRDDTHPSLTLLLQPIELKKRQRVAVADYLKNMQMLTITNMCTAMEYQISCDHQEKQKELKNSIAEGIGSKKIKLLHEWTLPDDVLHLDPHERPILSRRPRLKGTNLTTRNLAKSMVLASLEQSEIDHDLAILSGLGSF